MTARRWLTTTARGGLPSRADRLLAALLAALGVLDVWLLRSMPELRDEELTATVFVLAVPVALAWRRSRPVTAAAAVGGLLAGQSLLLEPTVTPPQVLTALLLSYSSAAHAPSRRAVLAWAALVGGVLVVAARAPDSGGASGLLSVPIFLTVPFLAGLAVRVARDHARRLEVLTEALQVERERTAELAAMVERHRLARELHDVVSHSVGVMTVQAGGARRVVTADPERAAEALRAIEDTGRSALRELERMLRLLRRSQHEPQGCEEPPGPRELDDLVARLRSGGATINVAADDLGALPDGQGHAVYRVVQEALTNALTHAPGAVVTASLRRADDRVVVTVANGRGERSVDVGTGHGLLGIRERVALYGGTVRVDDDGDSFLIEVTMPVVAP